MQNKLYSFGLGLLISLITTLLCAYYLHHQRTKTGIYTVNPYVQFLETLDHRFNDLKFKLRNPAPPKDNIVLLAIDDDSVREVGRFPWGRDVMATLTDRLMSYGVSTVGFDVIFSEPERGLPENDQMFAEIIKKYPGQIVLGAYSDDQIDPAPYQDFCINEAFLKSGGEQIVKLNASLIIDDTGLSLEDLNWGPLFDSIFNKLRADVTTDYLVKLNKKSVEDLSSFQQNFLANLKVRAMFNYCQTWLTEYDEVYAQNKSQLDPLYKEVFDKKEDYADLDVDKQIARFKSQVASFPVPQYGEWTGNIAGLQENAEYTASFNANLDLDGYVRRYPLFFRSGNRVGTSFIPSLSLQTYLASSGYRADVRVEDGPRGKVIKSFQIIDQTQDPEVLLYDLPVDRFGRLVINYYGSTGTLPSISAKDLFSDSEYINVKIRKGTDEHGRILMSEEPFLKSEYLKGRAVLVGATSTGIYDLRNTPVAANFPGPEIHMTVLANLFSGDFIKIIRNEHIVLPLVVLGVGGVISIILSFVGALYALVCFAISLVVFFFADYFVFSHFGLQVSSVFLLGQICLLHFGVFVFRYFSEELKKNEIKKTFSKYVSPAIVDELLKADENLKLGGRKQDMSVFFSDVRGFTTFSEKMDPQDLSEFLSEYLTPMTEVIFKNKGTLDKYMGDGLMAFFGAPVPFSDHAICACRAALQSLEQLKILQKRFAERGWPPIDIGIGVNSGTMSVGNMGSKIVQSYTVIGDAVNLGSRLESSTKAYGTKILVSEDTYLQAKDHFVFREVDRVRVKGKKVPIKAYELISEKADAQTQTWLKNYHAAYDVYHQRKFQEALTLFSQIKTEYPNDALTAIYLDRCQDFISEPPAPDWDGVYDRKDK